MLGQALDHHLAHEHLLAMANEQCLGAAGLYKTTFQVVPLSQALQTHGAGCWCPPGHGEDHGAEQRGQDPLRAASGVPIRANEGGIPTKDEVPQADGGHLTETPVRRVGSFPELQTQWGQHLQRELGSARFGPRIPPGTKLGEWGPDGEKSTETVPTKGVGWEMLLQGVPVPGGHDTTRHQRTPGSKHLVLVGTGELGTSGCL